MKAILIILLLTCVNAFGMECKIAAQNFAKGEAYKTLKDIGTIELVKTEIITIEHMYFEEYEITITPYQYHGPELENLTYFVKLMVQPNCEVVDSKIIQ